MNCGSFRKTANKDSSVRRNKQNRLILLANRAVCVKKKSRFIKNLKASRSLIKLGIRTPLSNSLLIGDTLFQVYKQLFCFNNVWKD